VPARLERLRRHRTDVRVEVRQHQAHKVRQWYPTLGQHKVIYRGPFVRGDTAKPLLAEDVVRGLVR